jgi:FkbM family methyltransferase
MKISRTYYLIHITNRCNNNCTYCIIKDRINKNTSELEDKLNKEKLFEYLQFVKKGDLVEITGGEPTLIEWLEELVQFLNKKEVYIILRTNGYKLFENRYKWLVVVFNPHNETISYRKTRKKLLKKTDVVLGENIPLEIIVENDKGGNKQPPAPIWNGARFDHPFTNSRVIGNQGQVWFMTCEAMLKDATPSVMLSEDNNYIDLDYIYEVCGGCQHLVAPWSWANRLDLENEVQESLIIPENILSVYTNLQDKESREIFKAHYFWDDPSRWNNWNKHLIFLRALFRANHFTNSHLSKGFWILGADNDCAKWLIILARLGIKGFIELDNDRAIGKTAFGFPVISVSQYLNRYKFEDSKIVMGNEDYDRYHKFLDAGIIADDVLHTWKSEQYFDLFKPENNEVFLDCGAQEGNTLRYYFDWLYSHNCKGTAIAFEASKGEDFETLKLRSEVDNIEIVNKALWNESNKKLSFGNPSGSMGASRINDEYIEYEVETITLDDYFKDREENITYIKMDIEGAELEALRGAKDIIRKYKPKLAISVYHKYNDIVAISNYLQAIVPQYKLWLRTYSNTYLETILYAKAD